VFVRLWSFDLAASTQTKRQRFWTKSHFLFSFDLFSTSNNQQKGIENNAE